MKLHKKFAYSARVSVECQTSLIQQHKQLLVGKLFMSASVVDADTAPAAPA